MGFVLSKIPPLDCVGSVAELIASRGNRKRKRCVTDDDSDESICERSLNTPKKKKLLSTAQYIYQTLYKDEKTSDIDVMAVGKVWHLHKVYLGQSPYFASMFSGNWREATQNYVRIEIIDPKINAEALDIVFGSLYAGEVTIEPKSVINVLATATLFQLDSLIDRCAEVMNETCFGETAIPYYEAACEYGVQSVKTATFNWLLVNLLNYYSQNTKWLRNVSVSLMTELVRSSELFVFQTEFSVYLILRLWVYLQLNPEHMEVDEKKSIHLNYFANMKDKTPFLQKKEGRKFENPFKALRIQYLLNHPIDLSLVIDDRLIPPSWLHDPLLSQWNDLLRIDQSLDSGPTECDKDVFLSTCLRCARILPEPGYHKWRWTGFNFGLDLILIMDGGQLSIKRHHRHENERILSFQTKRNFLIRLTMYSLNEQRQVAHSQTTDIKSISLEKNGESKLIQMDSNLVHPVHISVNLLVSSPNKVKHTDDEEETTAIAAADTTKQPTAASSSSAAQSTSTVPLRPISTFGSTKLC